MSEFLKKQIKTKRLSFTTDVKSAIKEADVIFIAVGTPMSDDGSADLSSFEKVASILAARIKQHKIIVTKSTVPIGTGKWLRKKLEKAGVPEELFSIVSNPEFLREGSALADFLYPDRVVIGVESDETKKTMQSIYSEFEKSNVPIMFTDVATAESIKYASNAFLATKISFINEIANLCDKTGANIRDIAHAMGLDERISPLFLKPGPGFGGSCFPKDCTAISYIAKKYNVNMRIIDAALEANKNQKELAFKKLQALLNFSKNINVQKPAKITLLGLAFKANTDDIRYSPAIRTIELLINAGYQVHAYDPQATENMKKLFPHITYHASAMSALEKTDACIVLTEWDEFKNLNIKELAQIMRSKIIVDARAILNKKDMQKNGFAYDTIG